MVVLALARVEETRLEHDARRKTRKTDPNAGTEPLAGATFGAAATAYRLTMPLAPGAAGQLLGAAVQRAMRS